MNSAKSHSRFKQIFTHLRNMWLGRNIAVILTICAIISAIATYWSITHSSSPFGPDPKTVLPLILTNMTLLLALGLVVTWKLVSLWLARRRGSVGSRLQTRIIIMFSLVSVVPTIIVAIFSAVFFNYGIQSWFDQRVGTALEDSVAVAEGYLTEHKENIRSDILAMANDMNRQSHILIRNKKSFHKFVTAQASLRSLTEAIVFRRSDILAKSDLTFSLMFELEKLPSDLLERASNGEVVVLTNDNDDRVRAMIKLNNFIDAYLIVGRFVDSKVLNYMQRTKGSVNEYRRLKGDISKLQIQFSFIFLAVALLLLLSALWVGIVFAGDLANPISELITATQRVKAGNFNARVKDGHRNDEIATLGRAFNRMTDQLQKQRSELVAVNRQIDERRRFIEAIFSSVTSGILAADKNKRITLYNPSVSTLLSLQNEVLKNKLLHKLIPEIEGLLNDAENSPIKAAQKEISLMRNGVKSTFMFRVVAEEFSNKIESYVVTFDDITELLTAQRSAAWQDVARRIAHEIKNPLTPIHLAADRLKSKYLKEIKSDPESFVRYTDTINRHVMNIGNIVEEFVGFARMPAPKMKVNNVCEIVKNIVFSEKTVNNMIEYELNIDDEIININCDAGQIAQVMTNLLKNASESLAEKKGNDAKIIIAIRKDKYAIIEVIDNGLGFPEDMLDKVTEPYVTTKENGTGLGMAIVNKVISDHDAKLFVRNISDKDGNIQGASVILSFPIMGS